MQLRGQTIIVTGASKGLGRTMAEAFLREGANVALGDLPGSGLESTIESFDELPGSPLGIHADVRSWDQVTELVETTIDTFGSIDVLVNNAGIRQLGFGEQQPVQDVQIDMWRDILDTNLTGSFLCTKATLPHLLEANHGRVLFITTGLWPDGRARAAGYVSSKFGMEGLARSLAHELAETNVQSMLLEPGGAVDTDLVAHMDENKRKQRMSPEVIAEPAVHLAAGGGRNGERYIATEMGLDD